MNSREPTRCFNFLVVGVLAVGLTGCGNEFGAEVSGIVTLDDKPVGPGMITFAPTEGAGKPSDGAIQIDGRYVMRTSGVVGIRPGKYRVGLTVLEQPDVAPGERSYVAPKVVTPAKYSDPDASGLEYDVASGDNTINIELTSQ